LRSYGKIDIYLKGNRISEIYQRLARIATAASTQQEGLVEPDVVPVGFDFDGEYFMWVE
jgi:hypothetical protein